MSIPLNELRLRSEIPHDKSYHHLVSNTDKTSDMHRCGSQKVQTQTESKFHTISQEPIIFKPMQVPGVFHSFPVQVLKICLSSKSRSTGELQVKCTQSNHQNLTIPVVN